MGALPINMNLTLPPVNPQTAQLISSLSDYRYPTHPQAKKIIACHCGTEWYIYQIKIYNQIENLRAISK